MNAKFEIIMTGGFEKFDLLLPVSVLFNFIVFKHKPIFCPSEFVILDTTGFFEIEIMVCHLISHPQCFQILDKFYFTISQWCNYNIGYLH